MKSFPTGVKLDLLVLWLVAEMARIAPDTEAWTSTVAFYTLRECDMLPFTNERHYFRLVERSLGRLRDAGYLTLDEFWGWRPRIAEAL